jgi:hypothetical protein
MAWVEIIVVLTSEFLKGLLGKSGLKRSKSDAVTRGEPRPAIGQIPTL